jgi:hypothetical protein
MVTNAAASSKIHGFGSFRAAVRLQPDMSTGPCLRDGRLPDSMKKLSSFSAVYAPFCNIQNRAPSIHFVFSVTVRFN